MLVPWPGAPLASRQRVEVRVRVWGEDGSESPWSEPASVEAGLLDPADWTARFVAPAETGARGEPLPLLRKDFAVAGPIARARLYVTALGLYELELNGQRVGDHVLEPGWTSYDKRLRYETHDVTDLLQPGGNALGALLGDGWYRGRIGYSGSREIFHDRLALLAQLEVVGADGSVQVVATDGSWRAAAGPILSSDLYDGEVHDARRERAGWSRPGHDESGWEGVSVLERDLATLVARSGPPVRRVETLAPVAVERSPSGKTLVDFGQNVVGRVRLTVTGPAGTTVTLRHAEALLEGELHTAPLDGAAQTDRYTLRGGEPETWEPRFTSHGFRYVAVDGWPGELATDDLVAIVCHSDMERTGWFECSDERVNRLHENVVWSMRGNFVDIPTDCPQREERHGWTGDVTAFAPTACFLYDTAGFFASWLADLALDQGPDGAVPHVVPNTAGGVRPATAVWGDVAVVLPWTLYERYGDLGLLRAQYPSMQAFVDHVSGRAGPRGLWEGDFQFGDWLDPIAPIDDGMGGPTDKDLIANAWRCHSLDLLARAAHRLAERGDAQRYEDAAAAAREAFAREYVTPNGRLVSDTQAAYAMAIHFDLLAEPSQREHAGRRLAELVEAAGGKLTTGFVGTPLLCDALCDANGPGVAYRLLMQEERPSWLFQVLHGATTIWEQWRVLLPDGRVNTELGEQNSGSHNHFALGAVGDWLHRVVGGLAPAEPGYRRIRVQPIPGDGLTWASTRHRTPYGIAESSWRLDGDAIEVSATVPPNVTATVVLPGGDGGPIEVGSGTHRWRRPYLQPFQWEPVSTMYYLIQA